MQKLAAASKIKDNDTRTVFVMHMSDEIFWKDYDKMKHVTYSLY